METKSLLFGIVGFMTGGLLVSIAATTFEKPDSQTPQTSSMPKMADTLKAKYGDEYDKEFMSQMIIHHEAAIAMAKMSETNAKHDEIKQLSKAIVSAQAKEIAEMKQWQQGWGYTSGNTEMPDMMRH